MFKNLKIFLAAFLIPGKKRGNSVYEETMFAIELLPKQFAPEIVILGCWNSWTQRNGKKIRAQQQSIQAWRFYLKQDLKLLRFKVKEKHVQELSQWIDNNI